MGKDNSHYFKWLELTYYGEPICINEYATRIAQCSESVHVIQLNDFQADLPSTLKGQHIDYNCEAYELVLNERPGHVRFTFANECNIEQTANKFKIRRNEHKIHVFQIPYHLQNVANEDTVAWEEIDEPDQVIFDLRDPYEKEAAQFNQTCRTFKKAVDLWEEKPRLVAYEETIPTKWKSSVHLL